MAKEAAKDISRGNDFNRTSDVCRGAEFAGDIEGTERTEEKTV